MDINKLTQKSQEALQAAQTEASRHGHVETDVIHLLCALAKQDGGLIPRLFERLGVDQDKLINEIEDAVRRKPRVSGPGVEPGKVYVSQLLTQLLDKAEQEAGRLKDEYVSTEHLLLAILDYTFAILLAGR